MSWDVNRKRRDGLRVYGDWAGRPDGNLENVSQCVEGVYGSGWIEYQCTRKRGHGREGLYCKQHAKSNL